MNKLLFLNELRWFWRLPIKWAVFGLVVLVVCFPYPGRLFRHLEHLRDPNALIEPDAKALQPFVEELRPSMTGDVPAEEALRRVERFVYEKIPYEWDWITWGTADYLPTVTEVVEMGKEDCDGRAVIAASLLANFGFKAELVTNFAHVWVKTDKGETMGPGRKQAIIATDEGLRVNFNAISELPKALAYSVAVFPLVRELIILAALWFLMVRSHGGVGCTLLGLAFLVAGLFLLRAGGENYRQPVLWLQWSGVAALATGIGVLVVWSSLQVRRAGRLGQSGAATPTFCDPGV